MKTGHQQATDFSNALVSWGMLALFLITPLALASNYAYGKFFLEAAVALLTLVWLWSRSQTVEPTGPYILLCGFLVIVGLQLIPWPESVLRLIAPYQSDIWLQARELTAQGYGGLHPITLEPQATASLGVLMGVYALTAWLVGGLTGERRASTGFAIRLAWSVSLAGLLVSEVALIQHGLGFQKIYGYFKPLNSQTFIGPFVNPNHFAGYLEMAFPWAMSLFLIYLVRLVGSSYKRGRNLTLLMSAGCIMSLMLISVVLSQSRAGTAIIFGILLVQALLGVGLIARDGWRRLAGLGTVGLLGVCAIAAMMTNWEPLLTRLSMLSINGSAVQCRSQLIFDTLNMVSGSPLLGVGFGTYENTFTPFKTLPLQALFQHAHCDYVELLAETGIIGFGLLVGFVVWAYVRGAKVYWSALRRVDVSSDPLPVRAIFTLGGLMSISAMALHSVVDFNLRIPANAWLFFANCGAVLGLVYRFGADKSRNDEKSRRHNTNKGSSEIN